MALTGSAWGAAISRDPYLGAIAMDARDGKVLFEEGADRPGYPASMLKMMNLFVLFDRIQEGVLRLDETVQVTPEASKIGGSQVYLDPRERFTVEELIYALTIQSANDAAMALALHVAGSREGFVEMMNAKSRALGLSPVTQFQSPHGLPPGKGQRPDMTTARDFAKLCQALIQSHPEVLKYTSATFRVFRQEPLFEMRTHNRLLSAVAGCDGLKTGYFTDAGYSIAATAQREGARVVVVVLGSLDRQVRDAKAAELINRYLPQCSRDPLPSRPVVQAPVTVPEAAPVEAAEMTADDTGQGEDLPEPIEEAEAQGGGWLKGAGLVLLGAFLAAVVGMAIQRRLLLTR